MKAVLTCDDVFDVLTRAPFPAGTSDDLVVESHLAVCHECRQLAEALRPAVGLFHEAMIEQADEELPAYRGRLSSIDGCSDSNVFSGGSVEPSSELLRNNWDNGPTLDGRHAKLVDALAAPAETTQVARSKQPVLSRSWWGIAGCVAAVLVATIALVVSRARPTDEASLIASGARVVGDRDVKLLASLDLPIACAPRDSTSLSASSFDCCTKCHTADGQVSSSRQAILKSSAACMACHDWLTDRFADSLSFIFKPRSTEPNKPSLVAVAALFRPEQPDEDVAVTANLLQVDNKAGRPWEGEVTCVADPAKCGVYPRASLRARVARMAETTRPAGGAIGEVTLAYLTVLGPLESAAGRDPLPANGSVARQSSAPSRFQTVACSIA